MLYLQKYHYLKPGINVNFIHESWLKRIIPSFNIILSKTKVEYMAMTIKLVGILINKAYLYFNT